MKSPRVPGRNSGTHRRPGVESARHWDRRERPMKTIDAIVEVLKREGVEFLSCYPTTPLIDAAAAAGLRPIVCRQERVGVGIADGFSRVSNGKRVGVFAMQFGPGAENAFPGVSTAYADSSPVLLLPLGYARSQAGVAPHFSAVRGYEAVTKWVEQVNQAGRIAEIMRRVFSRLRMGRPGPVMLEVPADVAMEDVGEAIAAYRPVRPARTAADPRDVDDAARVLVGAKAPVVHAGHGVLYAEATAELVELAELLQAPVMTTLLGKSAFPEGHPLALGTGGAVVTGPLVHFLRKADVVFGIGCSFTRHAMSFNIPPGKVIIHATGDERDINKNYPVDYPVIGDARLVLRQLIEAVKDRLGKADRRADGAVAAEVQSVREAWLSEWMPKLTSDQVPINPYRVIWELMHTVDPREAIITHDSGSPRDQIIPFYQAPTPRSYLSWGRSHQLGTGLGLIMGAKLAAPDKFCINLMGDAAFGMVGLDFETAVRSNIPILTIVLNNSSMAIETSAMRVSHERYQARDLGGNYADIGRALGGYAERVESPAEIAPAIRRARKATEEGRAALLEFITSQETAYSLRRAL
ncbi:MAG: thiamine pyrophosphate-requiring protein [Chloroflexi bacterium]|nr:thiamine pyrophosphate-requiring protein [Chloroflexota bacterium]